MCVLPRLILLALEVDRVDHFILLPETFFRLISGQLIDQHYHRRVLRLAGEKWARHTLLLPRIVLSDEADVADVTVLEHLDNILVSWAEQAITDSFVRASFGFWQVASLVFDITGVLGAVDGMVWYRHFHLVALKVFNRLVVGIITVPLALWSAPRKLRDSNRRVHQILLPTRLIKRHGDDAYFLAGTLLKALAHRQSSRSCVLCRLDQAIQVDIWESVAMLVPLQPRADVSWRRLTPHALAHREDLLFLLNQIILELTDLRLSLLLDMGALSLQLGHCCAELALNQM